MGSEMCIRDRPKLLQASAAPGRKKAGSVRRSGLLARPSLKSTAPAWWNLPQHVIEAANAFDQRHAMHVRHADTLVRSLKTDPTNLRAEQHFEQALQRLRWNRYHLEAELEVDVEAHADGVASPVGAGNGDEAIEGAVGDNAEPFSLDNSIWAPRKRWCDAHDYYDTEHVRRRMFETDFERAVSLSALDKFIARNDDDHGADADGDGRMDEIDEVRDVLWEYHELLTMVFDYFAACGTSKDVFHINQNGFSLFLSLIHI